MSFACKGESFNAENVGGCGEKRETVRGFEIVLLLSLNLDLQKIFDYFL